MKIEDICFDNYRECYYVFVRKRDDNLNKN